MNKGAVLAAPIRRAIQKEMADLVVKLGSQVAVSAALDCSPYAVGKAEKRGSVGPLIYVRLLQHLQMDEGAFLQKHGITAGDAKTPAVPASGVMLSTNNLAIALSEYGWNARLSLGQRGMIARQAIAGRERNDVDLSVEQWTKIIRRLEELMLEMASDFAKLGAAEPDAQSEPAPKESLKSPPGTTTERRRRATG